MPNVKVLLKDSVEKLGEIGEIVSVKPGYARNYLIPMGLAAIPTPGEIKYTQKKKEIAIREYADKKQQAEEIVKKLAEAGEVVIFAQAGEAGKLFGRITTKDIVEEINSKLGLELEKKQLQLKRSITEVGEFNVKFKLHSEVSAEVKLVVKKQEN